MEEEFQESEIVFPEDEEGEGSSESDSSTSWKPRNAAGEERRCSLPMKIPEGRRVRVVEEEWEEDGEEMVPPHVIVARRLAGKVMALSICTGNGIKGRYLSQLRNLVFRLTGFIET